MGKKEKYYDDESGESIELTTGIYKVEAQIKIFEKINRKGWKTVKSENRDYYFKDEKNCDEWIKKLEPKG